MLPSGWDPPQANKLTTKQMLAGVFWSNVDDQVLQLLLSGRLEAGSGWGLNQSENLRISFPKSIWSWMAGSCLARNVWFVGSRGGHKGFGTSMETLGKNSIKPERHRSLISPTPSNPYHEICLPAWHKRIQPKWCRIIYRPWFGASSNLDSTPISIHGSMTHIGTQGRVQRGAHRMRQRCSCGVHGSRNRTNWDDSFIYR